MNTNLKTLHMDKSLIIQTFKSYVDKMADDLLEEYYNEIKFQLKTKKGQEDIKTMKVNEENIFRRQVIGGAYAIIDSFGTGSEMDRFNPMLKEYIQSEMYNPLRNANNGAITGWGKETGSKKNIFGEPIISSGKNAGVNLENIIVNGERLFEPIEPSYAFQKAINWLKAGNRIQKLIKIMYIKFVDEIRINSNKYMRFY